MNLFMGELLLLVKHPIHTTTQDRFWGITCFLLILDGSPLCPTETEKRPLSGSTEKKGWNLYVSKVERGEKIWRDIFFRTCPPASKRPKGVGVMVKLGEKHPWKDKGVHPKSGRMVRDSKPLKTLCWLHAPMGSGAGSRIIPAHGWALD